MPQFRFDKEYHVAPKGHSVVTFRPGVYEVPEDIAAKAEAGGYGQRVQEGGEQPQTKAKQGAAGGGAKVGAKTSTKAGSGAGNKAGDSTPKDGGQ